MTRIVRKATGARIIDRAVAALKAKGVPKHASDIAAATGDKRPSVHSVLNDYARTGRFVRALDEPATFALMEDS